MNQFVIALLITACFVSTISAHKSGSKNLKDATNVPLLTSGQSMVIKGDQSKIVANEAVLYNNEEKIREGKLRVKLCKKTHGLYVNGRLVLKQDPNALVIKANPDLSARSVKSFEINVDPKGEVTYILKTSV